MVGPSRGGVPSSDRRGGFASADGPVAGKKRRTDNSSRDRPGEAGSAGQTRPVGRGSCAGKEIPALTWAAGAAPAAYGACRNPAFSASAVVRNQTSARVSRKLADSLVK